MIDYCERNNYFLRWNDNGISKNTLLVVTQTSDFKFIYDSSSEDKYNTHPVYSDQRENDEVQVRFYSYNDVSKRYELAYWYESYHTQHVNRWRNWFFHSSDEVHSNGQGIDWSVPITSSKLSYRIYDSVDDLSGNVPWRIFYSVGDTISNFSEVYNFITNHNEEYNTWITNYYDDNDDMPSLPDIIVYIRTIVPEPTPNPNPSPTPTPKPNTNTSTSDGVTVTQNANPVINVIVKIKNSLFPWGDDDEDEPETEEPTTEEPTSEEPTTEEPSSEDDPTKPIKERDENDDNPFWWLKSIFKWLKEIISDVGYIFEGIISALNSVLHAIIGQKGADGKWEGGLPTVIGDLIAYFLPFLPPEIITLLELSILLTVIVAIIHIIRK